MLVAMPLLAEQLLAGATVMEPKKCVGVMLLGVSVGVSVGVTRLGYEGFGGLHSLPFLGHHSSSKTV